MRVYITLAVLAGFIGVSYSTGELNIQLLVSGLVCAIFIFMAMNQVEKRSEEKQASSSREMKELLEALKLQSQAQVLTNQKLEKMSDKFVTLFNTFYQKHEEQLVIQKDRGVETVEVMKRGVEDINASIKNLSSEQIESGNQLRNMLADAVSELQQQVKSAVENHTKVQSSILQESNQNQKKALKDTKAVITEMNSQLKETYSTQSQQLRELVEGITSVAAGIEKGQDLQDKAVKGIGKTHKLQENLISEVSKIQETIFSGIEKNSISQENLIDVIKENEKVINSLVDQLMAISIGMSESKDLARERIVQMQERLIIELKEGKKVKAKV